MKGFEKAWEVAVTVILGAPAMALTLAMMAAPFVFAFEWLYYLRTGQWPGPVCEVLTWNTNVDPQLYSAICRPQTGWVGVDRIWSDLTNVSSMSYMCVMIAVWSLVTLAVFGGLLIWLASMIQGLQRS